MTAVGTHVVFGTGPAGRAVATALIGQGTRVRMVNRPAALSSPASRRSA